jgi:tyrosinase
LATVQPLGSRHPPDDKPTTDWAAGVQNNDEVNQQFKENVEDKQGKNYGTLRDSVYKLLVNAKKYLSFSTTTALAAEGTSISPADYLNCEGLHNTIHFWVGGFAGHMKSLEVASFDPIFWLHHW